MELTFERKTPLHAVAAFAERLVIQPIQPRGLVSAVFLVPDRHAGEVSRNGIPLSAGMHTLSHADRLETAAQTYWISGQSAPEQTHYDPALHGADVFCFLTKARLEPGQAITICPGVPGRSCSAIYKSDAWAKAMRPGSPIKCARCGFHPDLQTWQPDLPERTTRKFAFSKYFHE